MSIRSTAALGAVMLGALVQASFIAPAWADDRLKVVTTFTVLADMAAQVAGDRADVVSITKPGAEVHGYDPTPQDIVRAQGADLILWNGMNLEIWFAQFLDSLEGVPSVTLTQGITPIAIQGGEAQDKPNPHAWMSLENALIYIDNIEAAFVEHDPKNAQSYRDNAASYKEKLTTTIAPLKAQLDQVPIEQRWLVSCEGAFSYLAQDLGLKELYLWPINSDQMGTPRQVRLAIDGVRANNIPAVFCESTVNNAPAHQLARETGAQYGGMLYVDSLSPPDGPVPSYLDLLRVTTQTIVDGLTQASAP